MANSNRVVIVACLLMFSACNCETDDSTAGREITNRFRLDGKLSVPTTADKEWTSHARVWVDGGQFLGLVKSDGSFSVSSVPPGSYIVEVTHPTYVFDLVRVEISSKGKIRVRALNNIQPSAIQTLNYPLRLKARGQAQYFEKREQWRLTDVIYSPMIMMMVLPLGLMVLLPKLINSQDPEIQREMQNMSLLQPQQNLPDPAEWLTKYLGSGSSKTSSTKKKEIKNKPSKKQ